MHGGITIPDNLGVESNAVGTTLHFNEEKAPAAEQKIKQDQLSQGLLQPQKEEKKFIKGKLPLK